MKTKEFINNYDHFLEEINLVVKPELLPILEELREIDPNDLVRPANWFQGEGDARGFVWSLFITRALYKRDLASL